MGILTYRQEPPAQIDNMRDFYGRRTARENARLEIGPLRGRNSHQIGVLGIYDLQGLSYGRTELLVADMRLLAPGDPSGAPPGGRCH